MAVVGIEALAHDGRGAFAPASQGLKCVGHDRHVVVHGPEPFGAQFVGALDSLGEAAGPSGILAHGHIADAAHAALAIGIAVGIAPLFPYARCECGHQLGSGRRILVVDHDDAPRCHREVQDRLEQG